MVKSVEAYEAEDGTVFNTLEEAEAYEKKLNVKAHLETLFENEYKGTKIPLKMHGEIITFISENGDKFKELL